MKTILTLLFFGTFCFVAFSQNYSANNLKGNWRCESNEFGTHRIVDWNIATDFQTTVINTFSSGIGYKTIESKGRLVYDNNGFVTITYNSGSFKGMITWKDKDNFTLKIIEGDDTGMKGMKRNFSRNTEANKPLATSEKEGPMPSRRFDMFEGSCSLCNGTHLMNCHICGGDGYNLANKQKWERNHYTGRDELKTWQERENCTYCSNGKVPCDCKGRAGAPVLSCFNTKPPPDEYIWGYWSDGIYVWHFTKLRNMDGSFDLFKTLDNTVLETGKWAIENGVMKMIFGTWSESSRWEKYCVEKISKTNMELSNIEYPLTGIKLKRVD